MTIRKGVTIVIKVIRIAFGISIAFLAFLIGYGLDESVAVGILLAAVGVFLYVFFYIKGAELSGSKAENTAEMNEKALGEFQKRNDNPGYVVKPEENASDCAPANDEHLEETSKKPEKQIPERLGEYKTHMARDLSGERFPEKLLDCLPSPDKIAISAYGDDDSEDCSFGWIDKGAYVEWFCCGDEQDARSAFTEAYHPFIQKYTKDPGGCAARILRKIAACPKVCAVQEKQFLTRFNLGYINNCYEETEQCISYSQSQSESYHDGGGSSSEEWCIYPASITEEYYRSGAWKDGEHVYYKDIFGIPGIFEYYECISDRRDYDSDYVVRSRGVSYAKSELYKKLKAEK